MSNSQVVNKDELDCWIDWSVPSRKGPAPGQYDCNDEVINKAELDWCHIDGHLCDRTMP